ncbi:MAG TPA: hypothetical protein V6C72_19740 [Chroococcales cyanobacterium]
MNRASIGRRKARPKTPGKKPGYTRRLRSAAGGTLVLMLSLMLGIVVVILLFGLKYTRFLGADLEQSKAIEAAALAAARDLTKIVIEDPYFGFISLSDSAPIGTDTTAQDGYYMPVTGINTLLATIRLDLIIAGYANDPIMTKLAIDDYNRALQAKDRLNSALQEAILRGGSALDMDGNTVNPAADALDAYNANVMRMTGDPAKLVPGSFKLTLGFVNNLVTNTVIPTPSSVASVPANQQSNGFYRANMVIPYGGKDFVFAGLGDSVALVDHKVFLSSLAGLPYSIATVVRCEADEQYQDKEQNGRPVKRTIHAAAAAEAAAVRDMRPHPGAFTITVYGGPIPELETAGSLMTQGQLVNSPCDSVQTPLTGDYPPAPLSWYSMPELQYADPKHPTMGGATSIAFYDWVRRGGSRLSVKSVIDMLNTRLDAGIGANAVHKFDINSSGQIDYVALSATTVNMPVSQKQWRAISGLGFSSTNKTVYDVQLTDFVYQPGRQSGGRHGGETLEGDAALSPPTPPGANPRLQTFFENTSWPYFQFATGSGVRPTYEKSGISVDFMFRSRVTLPPTTAS